MASREQWRIAKARAAMTDSEREELMQRELDQMEHDRRFPSEYDYSAGDMYRESQPGHRALDTPGI